MKRAIEFHHVSAAYPQAEVLEDLCFSVSEGEMTALIGPNGAGKSTLFRVMTGLHVPSSGKVRLFGRDVRKIGARERSRLVAVVPQELTTPMAYAVEELVMMGRSALLRPWQQPSKLDRQVVERAMAYADISDLRNRTMDTLSGGEKQRAVIAMALAQEPRVILMDEPTTHLDMNHAVELMLIVQRLNVEHGVTVLMSSHDLNMAAGFCRRMMVLDHGRLAADGPPRDVLREDLVRQVYHCDVHILHDTVSGSTLVVPDQGARAANRTRELRVHVVSGGGSGCELLRRLCLGGYKVTCGALNRGDADAVCAGALGVETALEKPFSPLGPDSLERARELARGADAVVLCDVPFGSGNVSNISIAEEALDRGTAVLLNDRDLESRDYTGDKRAVSKIGKMLESGGVSWRQPTEVLSILSGIPDGSG